MNPSVFKSYDIRGIFGQDLDEETIRSAVRAIVALTNARLVSVGRDCRLSSPEIRGFVTNELIRLGVTVHDIGLVPVETIYYTSAYHPEYDAALMITASHNPKEYNGLKMMGKNGAWFRGADILAAIKSGNLAEPKEGGSLVEKDHLTPYLDHIRSFVDTSVLKPLKVVVDAGNGMAGKVVPLLTQGLPLQIIPLAFELDGNFPSRPPNPLAPGALDPLREKILQEHADVGVAFDADCDRVFFMDETGEFLPADITLILLAQEVLRERPGSTIVPNVLCTRAVDEVVVALGGKVVRAPVGYINVRTTMQKHGGIFGGETSAHYVFAENKFLDSGFVPFMKMMERLSHSSEPLSVLAKKLKTYERITISVPHNEYPNAVAKIQQAFHNGTHDMLDGITVNYPDWWLNVRGSNTEPILYITTEAATKEAAEEKQQIVLGVLRAEK